MIITRLPHGWPRIPLFWRLFCRLELHAWGARPGDIMPTCRACGYRLGGGVAEPCSVLECGLWAVHEIGECVPASLDEVYGDLFACDGHLDEVRSWFADPWVVAYA